MGERIHPWGVPVFTISSSDNAPPRLTLFSELYENCIIQTTRVLLVFTFRSVLIRRWSRIILKADEKTWTAHTHMIQTLSRWIPMRFTRTRHTSSTHLLALYANCRGESMRSVTEATNCLHNILSMHFAKTDVKATGLKSFTCFTLGFLNFRFKLVVWMNSSMHVGRTCYLRTTETNWRKLSPAVVRMFKVLYPSGHLDLWLWTG